MLECKLDADIINVNSRKYVNGVLGSGYDQRKAGYSRRDYECILLLLVFCVDCGRGLMDVRE